MTNPTPATPAGDSVTNPAGSVRAAMIARVRLYELDSQPEGYPPVEMKELTALANELEKTNAILAAVEKALAAWEDHPTSNDTYQAMSALRALHDQIK